MSEDDYAQGWPALYRRFDARRAPLGFAPGEALPAPDCDLRALREITVADPDSDPSEAPPFRSGHHRKRHALRREFIGQPELCFLHGLLVAHLRKRSAPTGAAALFQRLWAEEAGFLLDHLDARWQVSAITTFGDHGITEAQRTTGLALSTLFGMMKLYESERLYSGLTPNTAFPLGGKARAPLPLEMDGYSLRSGGLDVNMLVRLWLEAEQDAVITPLAHGLLDRLIAEDRGLIHRFRQMRASLAASGDKKDKAARSLIAPVAQVPDPGALRWGLVATVKAPPATILRWAAWHLDLGADALHIYLDDPEPRIASLLSRHPKVHVTPCDDAYWQASGRKRMAAHQRRQAFNATRTLSAAGDALDWLGHIDVDEFLWADQPVKDILASMPRTDAAAHMPPAEALAREDGPPRHFKLTHADAHQPRAVLEDIYPGFGLHLNGGFLSHTNGKAFVRTGIPATRLGLHHLKYKGNEVENSSQPDGLLVLHYHAPDWRHFRAHLDFRRKRGSYRARDAQPELGQAAVFDLLMEDGEDALRGFFDDVVADSDALRARLAARGMLVRAEPDLDGALARQFRVRM